jgi:hypothetical protein
MYQNQEKQQITQHNLEQIQNNEKVQIYVGGKEDVIQ